jgi:hypothetical protein
LFCFCYLSPHLVLSYRILVMWRRHLGPHLRTPYPGFNPGFIPRICYINGWGEPRVKPRVWLPEIWYQDCKTKLSFKQTCSLFVVILVVF